MSASQCPAHRGLSLRVRALSLALLFVVILGVYSNSFQNGFHFDDSHTVVDNPAIRSLANLPRFFTDTSTFSVYPANRTYRPLVSSTLALDYTLGHGLKPFSFHLGTFLFFLLMVAFTSLLFEAAMDRTEITVSHFVPALLGAAWFGLHPAMAETVNYVIQRGDLYCALGCVAALVMWANLPKLRRFGLYLLPYAAALLSKPPAAVFPLLLLFWTYFFERMDADESESLRWKRCLLNIIPSAVVTLSLLKLQSVMTPKTFHPSDISPDLYRLTQPFVWLRYTGELFLPIHLNVDTDLQAVNGLDSAAIAGMIFLFALLAIIIFTWKRRSWWPVTYGLLWFVLTQLPTSLYPLSELENDHRMFFSFPGLILAVAWCGWKLYERFVHSRTLRHAVVAVTLLLLGGYAYGAHVRNEVWLNEETLWRDDVLKSPHNGRGLMTYGLVLMGKGDYPQAIDYFTRALQYTPNYATLEINLGVVNGAMAAAGDAPRAAEAERHFQRAIVLTPNDDSPYAFYGRWLLEQDRLPEAIRNLQHAVELNPARGFNRDTLIRAYAANGDEANAHQLATETAAAFPGDAIAANELAHPAQIDANFWLNRSLAQSRAGQFADSLASAQRALALNPRSAEALNNIGAAYAGMQQWDNAVLYEQKALAVNPQLQIAKNNLAYYTQQKHNDESAPRAAAAWLDRSLVEYRANKFAESITAARHVLALDPHSAEAWNNIAAGNAAMHRWDAAIDAAQHAIALKPEMQLAKNNLAWAQAQKAAGVR